jgi:DNA-binding LacI/PurR family transcriptional regulator
LKEAGITPGRDIAVCAVADEFLAEYIEPAITTADAAMPDQAEAFLHACMQWIISGKAWEGPMLLQPADVQINVRASTANYKHTK